MKKFLEKAFTYVVVIFIAWGILSFIDVISHNLSTQTYHKWNLFVILTEEVQAAGVDATSPEVSILPKQNIQGASAHVEYRELTRPVATIQAVPAYELEMLARLINAEAGADWCTDEMMYGVGSVALNRVESDKFPDTLEGVIFQKGQYACTWDGNYNKEVCERAWNIAYDLLSNGSEWPENVLYQAGFTQGSVYKHVQNVYFCYGD